MVSLCSGGLTLDDERVPCSCINDIQQVQLCASKARIFTPSSLAILLCLLPCSIHPPQIMRWGYEPDSSFYFQAKNERGKWWCPVAMSA